MAPSRGGISNDSCRAFGQIMPSPSSHLKDHIEIIAKHEEEFLTRRTTSERVGDSIGSLVGSLRFIALHLTWFAAWILINTLNLGMPHFDPAPFPLLDALVALEAIFLASFIVMRQGRLSRRTDERDHLILQVLILAEKEVTAVLELQREMALKLGVTKLNPEITQLSQQTSIDEVAQTIKESIQNG
jgi:uncharacterized membrane protein